MATRTLGVKFQVVGFDKAKKSIEEYRTSIRQSIRENIKRINTNKKLDSQASTHKTKEKPNIIQQKARNIVRNEVKNTKHFTLDNIFDRLTSSFKVFLDWLKIKQSNFQGKDNKKALNSQPIHNDKQPVKNKENQQKEKVLQECPDIKCYQIQGRIIARELAKVLPGTDESTFLDNYKKALKQFRQGDVKGGLTTWTRKPLESVISGYYEAIGGEFGAKVGQKILGKNRSEVNSFKNRDYSDKAILVELKSSNIKELLEAFTTRSKNNNLSNFSLKLEQQQKKEKGSFIGNLVKPITNRIGQVSSGYYEGIGNYFGEQFATGLSSTLEEELDYSQKRKGRIFGKSVSFVANDGLNNLEEKFDTLKFSIADLNSETGKLDIEKVKKFFTSLFGIPSSLADSYLTGFRRASVQEEGARKVNSSNAVFNESIDEVENYKQAIITASGFAGEQGQQGKKQAEQLRALNTDKDNLIISSNTPFTDVMFQAKDGLSGAAWGVNAVANAAKINLKGFNPDAVELVNKVLALREKNPEIKIKLLGHSAGGFVAEEAQYLLELLGVKNTQAITAGTPNLKGSIKPENIKRIFAEKDPLEALHQVASNIDFVGEGTEYDSVPTGHSFKEYLQSENVRKAVLDRDVNTSRKTTSSKINPPEPTDDLVRDVISTLGDAIASAMEAEDNPEARIDAAREVIVEALSEFDRDSQEKVREKINEVSSIQLFDREQITHIYNLLQKKLDGFLNALMRYFVGSIDNALRDYRRSILNSTGVEKVYDRAQEILKDNRPRSGARVKQNHDRFFAVTGGYAGARGLSGARIATDLRSRVGDSGYVIHVPNRNTDPGTSPNQLDSISRPNIRGYSPDAIEIASQALAAHLKNPNIEINILGESGGGYAAEEAVYLLNQLGVPNVKGIGVGNPNFIGGVSAKNFTRLLSPDENLGKEVHEFWAKYYLADVSAPDQNIKGIDRHRYEAYLNTPQLQDFVHGSIGKTSRGRARTINTVSRDFLGLANQEMHPAQKDDFKNAAMANLAMIQRRIKQATGQAREDLLAAEQNFLTFLKLIEPGSEQLENYRSILQRGRTEVARRVQNPNKQQARRELEGIRGDIDLHRGNYRDLQNGDESLAYQAIDRELVQLQKEIDRLVKDIANKPAQARKEVVDRYRNHLRNKNRFDNATINEFVTERRSDYTNLDDNQKADYVNYFKQAIGSRFNDYRQALKANQLNLAKDLANSLLGQIQLIKEVYKDISQQLPNDSNLRKVIRGNQGYFTSLQTEIAQGQPNLKGRADRGLPDYLNEQLSLSQQGKQVVEGFIEAVLAELSEVDNAGTAIGDTIANSTEGSLRIESPSRRFFEIGQYIIAGLINGLKGFVDPVEEAAEGLENELESIETAISEEPNNNFFSQIGKFINTVVEQYPILGSLKKFLAPIAGLFLGGMGISAITSTLSNLSKEFLSVAMAAETVDKAIIFISRNANEGAKNLNFISSSAKRLGIEINTAKQNYASLIGAAKDTSLEGLPTEQVFNAFAETAAIRGLDSQSTNRLFTALSQMIAKRKLTAEEVRGQVGDIAGFGDFIGLVAQAKGVSTREIEDIMSRGELGIDVLPKVAAILKAQNMVAKGTQTAQTLQIKYNNSLFNFKAILGNIFQPMQKLILKLKAFALEVLAERLNLIFVILSQLSGVLLIALLKDINLFPVAIKAINYSVKGLILSIRSLITLKGAIASMLGAWLLVATAIKTVQTVVDLSKNSFVEAQKDIENLTKGIQAFSDALKDASNNKKEFSSSLPSKVQDLQLAEGFKLEDNLLGNGLRLFTGGKDRLNLDTIIREPLNKYGKYLMGTQLGFLLLGKDGRMITQAERKQGDFVNAVENYREYANVPIATNNIALRSAKKIGKYDQQILAIQSARLSLLPGDVEGLKKSLSAEQKIQKERNKQLAILTTQQQNLQFNIQIGKNRLAELNELKLAKGITEANYTSTKSTIESVIENSEIKLKAVNNELGRIPKQLSAFGRQLRNTNERVSGFIENRDRSLSQEKANLINEGLSKGDGERTIQIKLDKAYRSDIKSRIVFLKQEISKVQQNLESAVFVKARKRIEEAAVKSGGLTTDVINRLLDEERDPQEKEALKAALAIRQMKGQLFQYEEQLASSTQQNKITLIDYDRTIKDYFFNLSQRISEAQLEAKTITSKLLATDIKAQLKNALVPGSESFVNGLINGVQSVLDQAQALIERELGLEGNRIQLESESYSLEREMQDFIRSVNGATDALLKFSGAASGERESNINTSDLNNEGADVAKNALSWEGKHFKEGVYAMCAGFVRQVLKDSGVDVGVSSNPIDAGKQPNNGELMARSFFGDDIGKLFRDKNEAQPGDIIGFFDTYDYGQQPGAITHVGIYQGNDMMVDRSTSSAPIKHRSIDTFGEGNYVFVRPHDYVNDKGGQSLTRKQNNTFINDADKLGASSMRNRATTLKNQYIKDKARTIELNETLISQEREMLDISAKQQLGTQERQLLNQRREGTRQQFNLTNRLAEFGDRGRLQTAEVEYQRTLRQTEQQFRDINSELATQKTRYLDTVNSMEKFIADAPSAIAKLRANGQNTEANFVRASAKQFESYLPDYKKLLEGLGQFESQLPELQQRVTAEIERQRLLKIEAENITKRNTKQQLKTFIATQRGTNELRRQNEIATERLRLEQRINQIRLKHGDTDYTNELIATERQNSLVKEQNIDRAAVDRERQYERKLLDLDAGIKNARGDRLIGFGNKLGGNALKREAAIAKENFRYQQELLDIEKTYAGNIEKITILKQKAEEFNRVSIERIKQQFKDLKNTLLEMSQNALTGFFENSFAAFYNNGDKERQELEQKLKYKEELLALEEKYRDNPDELDFARERVRKLNEEKLDKIKQEFNIFNQVVKAARNAVIELLKQIAKAAAIRAAGAIIGSIVGNSVAPSVSSTATSSLNFDGGIGAFTAKYGATVPDEVPNYLKGGMIKRVAGFSRSPQFRNALSGNYSGAGLIGKMQMLRSVADAFKSYSLSNNRVIDGQSANQMRRVSPGINRAFQREGSRGVLGVFTPGEEILSIKTGEAGRYQSLKRDLGIDPLKKIFQGNFKRGGTIGKPDIEGNLLRGFDVKIPSINLAAVGEKPKTENITHNVTNFSATIVTPNADSFRESEYQRQQDIMEALVRAGR